MTQTKEQKQELEAAQAAAPDEAELRRIAASVPPLSRDPEHSFVPVEDTELADLDPEAEPSEAKTIEVQRPDRAESTYERSTQFSEVDLERLSDEQIKDSKVLSRATPRVAASHLAPSSDRPRSPGQKVPAAGAGSWPVNESQMPAVMPTDPEVTSAEQQHLDSDNGFAKRAGFTQAKDGTLRRKGLKIGKGETVHAAALYLRLRQMHPSFTEEQLADEFELQWLSGRSGAEQSHRAGAELSQHGLTAVGDDRVDTVMLGKQRAGEAAFEADPEPVPPAPSAQPEAGLPSENEPASTAPDQAKKPSGETAEADAKAVKATADLKKETKQ